MDELTKEFVAESQEGLERMEFCVTELEKRPGDAALVAEIFRAVHTIKGTTGFLGFTRLEKVAHAGEHLLGAVRDGKVAVTTRLISGLLDLMDGLRSIVLLIEAKGTEGRRSADEDAELIALLTELRLGMAGEAADAHGVRDERTEILVERSAAGGVGAATAAGGAATAGEASPAGGVAGMPDKTLRIDVEVLNRMMNLVGELVLTRNQILQSAPGAKNFGELSRRLDSVTAELRESVMEARMQPVAHLFGKFPRMVRDLAKTCGRQVRIEFEGQETGLDKSLLEAIRDPLTHAVRNSVDHGIEPPEARVKAGKAAEGVLRLRAFHQSGWVVIELSDDGAGISTQHVLAKAIERGLVTPEQAETMSEREALQLVFVAGFSTAKEVTNISGRGVGMDVVRANVEKVGGSVELESRVGLGTTVRLRVPLTLAIVRALVVCTGGQRFALPQNSLVELVYVPLREAETAVERIGTSELYRLRERLLPLIWLDRLLELEHKAPVTEEQGFYIAVVESEGRRFGLVVDDLMAPEEIVVKPLSAALREIGMFSGATVLGSGVLAMILDVAAVGARAGVRPMTEEASALDASQEARMSGQDAMGTASAAGTALGAAGTESAMVIYETVIYEAVSQETAERGQGGRGRSGQMAMPLSAVERIESVPLSEIEYAGGRALLQYRGELLALEDEGGLLQELAAAQARGGAEDAGEGMATVLICLREGAQGMRRAGMVVRSVLDVTAGRLLAADGEVCEGQLAMVKNRVTALHREPSVAAEARPALLREVA